MFYTKKSLEEAVKTSGRKFEDALLVSQDRADRDGSFKGKKGFFFCGSTEEYLAQLRAGEHMHEVLPDRFETRCWVYADIDEASDADEEEKERKTREYVSKMVRAFTLSLEDVGRSVQVLTSHSPTKLSVHVLVYIESFPAEVAVRMERVDASVPWDPSVYSMFRSYRAAYHRKGGKDFRLVPWGGSSVEMEDHLVRILPGDRRQPVTKLSAVAIPPNKKELLERKRKAPREGGDPCRSEMIERIRGTDLLGVIKVDSVEQVIGEASKKNDRMFAYVERGFTCPFKGEPHRSNRGYVVVEGGVASLRCLAPGCRGKSVDLRDKK